ncbi:MAG: chorismate synthase [Deltaproteobacteria bacterium]|nr:MAG: chorismate synthase [Deltaproteobacteria bacterium]
MLRFLTAGESHGKSLTVIIEGFPADVPIQKEAIDRDLARRQISYGRGKRMEIEKDQVEITAGVRWGKTLGSPISLTISNKDWVNWQVKMSIQKEDADESLRVTRPRPGHADLAGALKYNQKDIRNVLERSSARETAARVAVGAVCKLLLKEFDIHFYSFTRAIGGISANLTGMSLSKIASRAESSEVRCADNEAAKKMKARIDEAKKRGDTLGGVVEIVVTGVPPGLGSHVHWDRKLDGRIAQSLMSVQAVKGVEIGLGFESAQRFGSQVHDEIFFEPPLDKGKPCWGFYRKTNNAGGIEGGISNGEPVVVRCAMKPISTLMKPLKSVDIISKKPEEATVERSDICRVPSLAVIGEAVVAFEIARAFLEKFGGDSLPEISFRYQQYLETLKNF